eukprot:TRINITY_DN32395_c0_g1_i1.p1 TRINITY_DN32395_c0_g1~~TRINITY_DN32395_c0_g1_i1.p1  ORF type:complete len:374 (+),score=96.99 TRINITY_DN32395_c0_g1_i1:67-1188(+)
MGDPTQDIATMANQLDLIEDVMGQGGEGEAAMVQEMLQECAESRAKLEHAALVVLEKGGDQQFNQISALLERLERLQERAKTMGRGGGSTRNTPAPASPAWQQPQGSPSGSVSRMDTAGALAAVAAMETGGGQSGLANADAFADFGAQGSFGTQPASDAFGEVPASGKKDKKSKKSKKEATDSFGFPSGGDFGQTGGAWPAQTAQPDSMSFGFGDDGMQRIDSSGVADSGPSAADGGASFAAFGAAPTSSWGVIEKEQPTTASGSPGFGASQSRNSPALSTRGFEQDASGWGAKAGGFGSFSGSGSFSAGARYGDDALGGPGGYKASLQIRRPFSEIGHDTDGFERLFIREVATAAGIAPHRIRITSIRPGYD